MKKALCITLYNPVEKYLKHLESILDCFDIVFAYDNTTYDSESPLKKRFDNTNVHYISSNKNNGLSKAFNDCCDEAVKENIDWILFLDQDSVFEPASINELFKFADSCPDDVGMVGPRIIYQWEEGKKLKKRNDIEEANWIITSGSVLRIEAFKKTGHFDEFFFINYIEPDYCWNLRKNGYKILVNNDIHLHQVLGYDKNTHPKEEIGTHSPLRMYYTHRNRFRFIENHKSDFGLFTKIKYWLKTKFIYIKILFKKKHKKEFYHYLKKAEFDFKHGLGGQIQE